MKIIFTLLALGVCSGAHAQTLVPERIIGISSEKGFPNFTADKSIVSPKSASFTPDGSLLLINALEASKTIAYDTRSWNKVWEVSHSFSAEEQAKHQALTGAYKDYFRYPNKSTGWFAKPVEMTISADGKTMFTSSYRKSFDPHAHLASSVSAIDIPTGKIKYSLPAGPIPKMLSLSPDNKTLAVSNWGDNTVSLWNISNPTPSLIAHTIIDYHLKVDSLVGDRDKECGHCLRGTSFTPDGKYVLVSRMSGSIGLDVLEADTGKRVGLIPVPYPGVRHLTTWNNHLVASSTGGAWIAIVPVEKALESINKRDDKLWQVYKAESSVRTVSVSGNVLLAAKHSKQEVALFDLKDRKWISQVKAPAWPVGAVLANGMAVATAQGHKGSGGHKVAIYRVVKP